MSLFENSHEFDSDFVDNMSLMFGENIVGGLLEFDLVFGDDWRKLC
jgi:hypothetical protein